MAEASPWSITVVILSRKWHLCVDIHTHPLVSLLAQTSKISFRVYTTKTILMSYSVSSGWTSYFSAGFYVFRCYITVYNFITCCGCLYFGHSYIFDVFSPLFWQCKIMLLMSAIPHITWVIKRDLKKCITLFFFFEIIFFSPCQANVGTAQQINPFSMATTALPSKLKQQSIITLRHEGQSVWKKSTSGTTSITVVLPWVQVSLPQLLGEVCVNQSVIL